MLTHVFKQLLILRPLQVQEQHIEESSQKQEAEKSARDGIDNGLILIPIKIKIVM